MVEALGRSDSQNFLPTKVSLGKYSSIKQRRDKSSLFPMYYSYDIAVRGTSNNGLRERESVFILLWESIQ